jgi:hypothetical protein
VRNTGGALQALNQSVTAANGSYTGYDFGLCHSFEEQGVIETFERRYRKFLHRSYQAPGRSLRAFFNPDTAAR